LSWNNTVRCSHCWTTGHNKAGCAELREKMQKRIDDDPDDWRAKQYFEHKARSKKRSCGYCKEEGHTKRTCKHIEADKNKTTQMNREWRANALNYFKDLGLGVGALVQFVYKRSWGEDQVENVLVSEILWKNLTFMVKNGSNPYSFRCRPLNNGDHSRLVDFPMDPAGVVSPNNEHGLAIRVLGPVSGSSIEASMPENWLSGEGEAIDNMFLDNKGKTKERYYIDWVEK
jgi:hypothetical protein